MKRAALRARTLPSSHPLRASLPPYWAADPLAPPPMFPLVGDAAVDAETPLTFVDRYGRVSNEDFSVLHPEAQPGARLHDVFADRITLAVENIPVKGSDEFDEWVDTTFLPQLYDAMHDPAAALLFTDGSLDRRHDRWRSGAAFVLSRGYRVYRAHRYARGVSSVFDTEMFALAAGIAHAVQTLDPEVCSTLYVYVDNRAAARAILDPSRHASQLCSIVACQNLRRFLERSPRHRLVIRWCPSHVGIAANEFVDTAAKDGSRLEAPDDVSWSAARSRAVERMLTIWRTQAETQEYRGHQFRLTERYRRKLTHTTSGNTFMAKVGNDSRLCARLARILTGHAPIGAFRERFHLDGPVD